MCILILTPFSKSQVVVDPLQLGDCTRRRRIYIAVIHRRVLRGDIDSEKTLEVVLQKTLDKLKVIGPPPDPSLNSQLNGFKPFCSISFQFWPGLPASDFLVCQHFTSMLIPCLYQGDGSCIQMITPLWRMMSKQGWRGLPGNQSQRILTFL